MSLQILKRDLEVPINLVVPNSWNINKQSQAIFNAQIASISAYGMIDSILVREIPNNDFLQNQKAIEARIGLNLSLDMTAPTKYEIIDGEHRLLACLFLEKSTIPINLIKCSDDEAKKLTLIFIETRGSAAKVDIAKLLQDIDMVDEELAIGLPYEIEDIQKMLGIDLELEEASQALEESERELSENNQAGDNSNTKWHKISILLPDDFIDVFQEAYRIVEQEIDSKFHSNQEIAYGQFLEVVIANYLAS